MLDLHSAPPVPANGHRGLLLIGAREPIPGQCKTRLGACIGMERAAALYRAFLVDIATRFTTDPSWPAWEFDIAWAYTPAGADFAAVLRDAGCPAPLAPVGFVPQDGDGWGERQANLLRRGAALGYARTVLIASDAPQISVPLVQRAFTGLLHADLAVARSHDGGYSLIGLRGYHDVLSGVPMSTSDAGQALIASGVALGLRVMETPPVFDVDDAADLALLTAALAPDGAAAPATWRALGELGLRPALSSGLPAAAGTPWSGTAAPSRVGGRG